MAHDAQGAGRDTIVFLGQVAMRTPFPSEPSRGRERRQVYNSLHGYHKGKTKVTKTNKTNKNIGEEEKKTRLG